MSKRMEDLESMVYRLTKQGCSAATAIGDDLEGAIEGACDWFDSEDDVFDLVEGELESFIEVAQGVLGEVKELRKKPAA